MTGTVFDIGYRNYTGPREGRGRALRAVMRDGVRTALGLGRGSRAKILPWFFIVAMSAMALLMAIIAGAAEKLGGPGAAERANLPTHSDFYGLASIVVFVFGALIGPELLCRDRREGVLQLYLVRPLTASDYVVARWGACLAVLCAALWLPQAILFAGLALGDPTPLTYVRGHWRDVPHFLLAGLALAAYVTTLALLTASYTSRRAYAAVFLIGLFVVTTSFTVELANEVDGTAGQWLSMFNLTNIPVHVNDIIFGEISEVTSEAPARLLPARTRIAWYFAWTLGPAALLWWRYRRMSA